MARVEIASMPWGVLQDRHGESQNGTTATLKNLDGSNATTWSAITGGSSSTSSLTADSNGNLPRFVEGGQYTLDVPALGVSGRRVEAVSGSVESDIAVVREAPLNLDYPEYAALVSGGDNTPALQAAVNAADTANGTVIIPARSTTREFLTPLTPRDNVTVEGFGPGSEMVYKQNAGTRFIDLTASSKFKLRNLTITADAVAPNATLLYLSNAFGCGMEGVELRGQHSASDTTTYRGQTGIELRANAGDNHFTNNFRLSNLGTAVKTSAIQNYFANGKIGNCYKGVWGDTGTDVAGIQMNDVTFNGSAAVCTRHLLCEVQGSRWWFTDCWLEGADVGVEMGKTGVGGPAEFVFKGGMVASTTRNIDLVYTRQTMLLGLHLTEVSGATTCDPLRINATDAIDGIAMGIANATTVGGFELDPSIFPSRWLYVGRTKMQLLANLYGALTMQPEADGDVPLTINGRSGTTANLLEIYRGATLYYNWDRFGGFFAQQAGLSAKTSVKMTAVDGTAFIEQGEQSADPSAPAANFLRTYPKDLSGKTMLARRDSSRVELLPGSLQGTATWDPASLANGASEVKSVTVTGAAVGDAATAGLTTIAATGWVITAVVIAADTVEVKITNNTGGVVDLGSGTVRAVVTKFS